MMPFTQNTHPSELEQGPQAQRDDAGLVGEQVPPAEEASTSVMHPTPRGMSEGLLSEVFREANGEDQGCSYQAKENLHLHNDQILQTVLKKEAIALIPYLLYKYWSNQPVSNIDMINHITGDYRCYFPEILDKASVFMQLLFGIDIKEIDPILHTHVLFIAAGISYDGVTRDVPGMPKSGLLIIVLCIIFMEGNCATDEAIWQVLSKMEVYPDSEHFIYGNPRRLLMEDFVWEQYLDYQQVPGSDPIVYEFKWGPRAHAETTQRRILEHWAKFSRVDPRSFGSLYEEALQEEQEANTRDNAYVIEE
ncbi:melanoma-associated antigen 11-like [Thomomys bottae]